jgi:type II restriction enzyme
MSKNKNKGEWSELYAFAKILSDRNLVGADQNLNPIEGENYPVLKILKNSDTVIRTYDLSSETGIRVSVESNGQLIENHIIPSNELNKFVPKILNAIKKGKGAFEILEGTEFVSKFSAGNIKTNSLKKGDIEVVVYDKITSMPSSVEYSIKSYLGALPTLLNASQLTNFTYVVEKYKGALSDINDIDKGAKIQDRTNAIIQSGAKVKFHTVESPTFLSNLRKIDSKMPEIIGEYILAFNLTGKNSLKDITEHLCDQKLIDGITGYEVTYEELKYKIKQFFLNVALGMVPKKKWDGFIKADGGYIVVKETGEIVCFHIYNISQLSEYLFNNTKLQNPSSKRNKFGALYNEDGLLKFKLNLNVRFSKLEVVKSENLL